MTTYGLPILYTLLLWWFSTGAVLYVVGRPRQTLLSSMAAASLAAVAAGAGIYVYADDTTASGAYIGFSCALILWGWHEMSFLTGFITGPRTTPLPEGTSGSARLLPAIETVIYHELALFLTLIGLAALTYGSPNEVALWTFAILWLMRLSAKLNVYLGVPNLTEEFLPEHIAYLKTYFRRRHMNLLFPLSITASTVTLAMLVQALLEPSVTDFEATSLTLLATLTALGLLEHWFLVIPLPVEALWSWGMASREMHSAGPPAKTEPAPATLG